MKVLRLEMFSDGHCPLWSLVSGLLRPVISWKFQSELNFISLNWGCLMSYLRQLKYSFSQNFQRSKCSISSSICLACCECGEVFHSVTFIKLGVLWEPCSSEPSTGFFGFNLYRKWRQDQNKSTSGCGKLLKLTKIHINRTTMCHVIYENTHWEEGNFHYHFGTSMCQAACNM